jgi:hypothetical protein
MIDKMVNCTAAKNTDLTGSVYGDYMDGIESIVFTEDSDLSGIKFMI